MARNGRTNNRGQSPNRGSMIRPRDNRNDTRGFTVIEVMIALVVTLIALDVVFGGIVTSLRTVNTTASWDSAISRAESHLAAITDPPLSVKEMMETGIVGARASRSSARRTPQRRPRRSLGARHRALYGVGHDLLARRPWRTAFRSRQRPARHRCSVRAMRHRSLVSPPSRFLSSSRW